MQHDNPEDFDEWEDAQQVEERDVRETLEQALEHRPEEDSLQSMFKGQKRSSMSNVLSATAHELEIQITSDSLSHALGDLEKRRDEVAEERGSLSNVLSGTAHELERNIVADKVSQGLDSRPSEEELEQRGIQRTKRGSMSDVLASTAVELEKQMTMDKVAHSIETRPNEHQLEECGIIKGKRNSSLSNALVPTAVQLERKITQDIVAHSLESRPTESDLESRGLIRTNRGSMSDVLAATAVQLEKEMKADVVSATLHKRASDLNQVSPPMSRRSSLSNVLAANAKELERNMVADSVSSGLSRRPSQQNLLDKGILKRPPSESKLLAATAVTLEKALTHDRINDKLLTTVQAYVSVTSQVASPEKAPASPSGLSVKERTEAYMKAVRDANSSPKFNTLGLGIRERLRAYEQATKSSPPYTPESKTADSPTASPASISGLSLKERMAMYSENASSLKVKKEVEITEVGTIHDRVTSYVGAAVPDQTVTEGEKEY